MCARSARPRDLPVSRRARCPSSGPVARGAKLDLRSLPAYSYAVHCRKILALAVVCALTWPALFACVMQAAPQAQSMPCCSSFSACAPTGQSDPCLSKPGRVDSWKSGPEARAEIAAEPLDQAGAPVPPELSAFGDSRRHQTALLLAVSPPQLYSLHHAFLI